MRKGKSGFDEDGIPKGRWQEVKAVLLPRLREIRFSLFLLKKSKLSLVGIGIILFMAAIALSAPYISTLFLPENLIPAETADPIRIPRDWTVSLPLPPGTPGHPLGTGQYAMDIYYGIVWGARVSMWIAIFVVGLACIIGVALGAVSGYFGGVVDEIIMRVTDVFLSIPGLILAMAVVIVLGYSLDNIMLALALVWWPAYTRIIRGQILSIRENTYVEAAKSIGAGEARIIFKQILPNSLAPLFVAATMDMGTIVLVTAALGFIGFGAPPGSAEWGVMISDGQNFFLFGGAWWMVLFPGIAIMLFVLGFNLLGDGLRDVMDPKLRK